MNRSMEKFAHLELMISRQELIERSIIRLHDRLKNVEHRELLSTSVNYKKKCIQFLWALFCFAGCGYQGYHITDLYMQWDINAEFFNYPRDPIDIPAITVCFDSPYKEPCPSVAEAAESSPGCNEFIRTSTIFFSKTIEPHEFFSAINVNSPLGERTRHDTPEKIQSFLEKTAVKYKIGSRLCLQVDVSKVTTGRFTYAITRNAIVPTFITFDVKEPWASYGQRRMLWCLTEPGDLPDNVLSAMPGPTWTRFKTNTYQRTSATLLKPPYITKCRDYKAEHLQSQHECLQKCQIREAKKLGRPIPSVAYQAIDDAEQEIPNFQQWWNLSDSLYINCDQQCKQIGCDLVFFHGYTLSEVIWFDNSTVLGIQLPVEPDMVVVYKAKMTFAEFAALLGSIAGLWLGLSVFSVSEIFFFIIDTPRRHRNRVSPVNQVVF